MTTTAGRDWLARVEALLAAAHLGAVPLERIVRLVLLTYVLLVAAPVRFWQIRADDIDYTWIFALNYAAAHGLAFGRDLVWTNGPLGFLTFPQNIGHNLPLALLFQAGLWILLATVYIDLFLRAGIPLARLALFSLCIGLASPLFWFNRNSEDVLVAGVLTLLVMVRFDQPAGERVDGAGGLTGRNARRYLSALVLIGLLPLIKLSGGIHGALALGGFLLDRVLTLRRAAWREVLLALLVPLTCYALGLALTMPSPAAVVSYWHQSWDLASGVSVAASGAGSGLELAGAFGVLAAIVYLLWLQGDARVARFYLLLLALPLIFALKHGFIRPDDHIINFFCFAALAIGLIALYANFSGWRAFAVAAIVLPLPLVCMRHLSSLETVAGDVTGLRVLRSIALAARSVAGGEAPADEHALMGNSAPTPLLSPELRAQIGKEPVAVLSLNYAAAYFDDLNLRIYPVVQLYSAWTPYLDQLSAEWIRSRGPRYLVYDGHTIDHRHPWAQTPALWAEVYRDYDSVLVSGHNLLLERRGLPRYRALETVRTFQVHFPGVVTLPPAEAAEFWSLSCPMTTAGFERKVLFRVLPVTMEIQFSDGHRKSYRSIMNVMSSPLLGEALPTTLADFAATFAPESSLSARATRLVFAGAGAGSYQAQCQVRWLRIVR
jgi:hypothetical protein